MMTKKKVSGRTSEEKVRQHMMNYMIEKIQRLDEKIRLTKEEQQLVQEEMKALDSDIVQLEDELDECRKNGPSRAGAVFPSMDIRYKVVKPGDTQSDLTSDENWNLEQGDKETDLYSVIEEGVKGDADCQAVEKSDLEETLAVESLSVLQGDLFDVESKNAISGLRGTQEAMMEEKSKNEKGSETCEEKLDMEEEKHQESDETEKEVGRRLEQRSMALVCKADEVIIDCDSD